MLSLMSVGFLNRRKTRAELSENNKLPIDTSGALEYQYNLLLN